MRRKVVALALATSNVAPQVGARSGPRFWEGMVAAATNRARREPILYESLRRAVLDRKSFDEGVIHRVAHRLSNHFLSAKELIDLFDRACECDVELGASFEVDFERKISSATINFDVLLDVFLYSDGFWLIESQRFCHWLWRSGWRDFSNLLHSRIVEVFGATIHPSVVFGRGTTLDRPRGLAIDVGAIIEDKVTIIQDRCSSFESAERSEIILPSCAAAPWGALRFGAFSRILIGSVINKSVPAYTTIGGSPAGIVDDASLCSISKAWRSAEYR